MSVCLKRSHRHGSNNTTTFIKWYILQIGFTYIGINGWNICLHWAGGLLYMFMEFLTWPKRLMRYKVQPNITMGKSRLLSVLIKDDLWHIDQLIGLTFVLLFWFSQLFRVNLLNQFCVTVPYSIIGYYVLKSQGNVPPIRELPTLPRLVMDFIILIAVQEVLVYYTHR